MASASSSPTDSNVDRASLSICAQKFNITNIKQDRNQWNRDWEKILNALTNASEVYELMGLMFSVVTDKDREMLVQLRDLLKHRQDVAGKIVTDMFSEGNFETIWFLLDEPERKRHLLEGLEGACVMALRDQDARSMCPEISTGRLLKARGQGFIDFLTLYRDGKKSADPGEEFSFPSKWWEQALQDLPQPLSDRDKFTYEFLTTNRNEFIACFAIRAVLSVAGDVAKGSKGMDPVIEVMKAGTTFARSMAEANRSLRDKPLIRCENCEKSVEDFEPDTKFSVCSVCKAKLNWTIHYCSRQCQKEDWPKHKQHCGKKKVSKGLPGTAGDSMWAFPDPPDVVKDLVPNASGNVSITSIGAGQAQYTRSSALQLQVTLIEANKGADYFLFKSTGMPIPFIVPDTWAKMVFRLMRKDTMSNAEKKGLEPIAEYMLKHMADKPGLSREIILRQLCAEYGDDTARKVIQFERRSEERGSGLTFIESMSKGLGAMGPRLMSNNFV